MASTRLTKKRVLQNANHGAEPTPCDHISSELMTFCLRYSLSTNFCKSTCVFLSTAWQGNAKSSQLPYIVWSLELSFQERQVHRMPGMFFVARPLSLPPLRLICPWLMWRLRVAQARSAASRREAARRTDQLSHHATKNIPGIRCTP